MEIFKGFSEECEPFQIVRSSKWCLLIKLFVTGKGMGNGGRRGDYTEIVADGIGLGLETGWRGSGFPGDMGLLSEVDFDSWGLSFRIVTKKLGSSSGEFFADEGNHGMGLESDGGGAIRGIGLGGFSAENESSRNRLGSGWGGRSSTGGVTFDSGLISRSSDRRSEPRSHR